MSRDNLVRQVRPGSTFENFKVYHEGQQEVVDNLSALANGIVEKAPRILAEEYPFDAAKIIFLWSPPGRGKTHLVESIVNRVRQRAPKVVKEGKVYLARDRFCYRGLSGTFDGFGESSVVIVDDMFVEYQSIKELHPATDIRAIMLWVAHVYERRALSIVTSNFPLMKGIADMVRKVDQQGRTLSRLEEMLANSGEIELPGHDYRSTIAEETRGSLFKV